jgi:hypothetical protein
MGNFNNMLDWRHFVTVVIIWLMHVFVWYTLTNAGYQTIKYSRCRFQKSLNTRKYCEWGKIQLYCVYIRYVSSDKQLKIEPTQNGRKAYLVFRNLTPCNKVIWVRSRSLRYLVHLLFYRYSSVFYKYTFCVLRYNSIFCNMS